MPILEYKRNGRVQNDLELNNNGSSASINDNTTSEDSTWSSKKINSSLDDIANELGVDENGNAIALETTAQDIRPAINELKTNINSVGSPTDEQVQSAINQAIENGNLQGISGTTIYIGDTTPTNGELYWYDTSGNTEDTPITPVAPTTYSITNNLTNCTNSNSATSVEENSAYTATITADSGYELGDITITMGGTDITSTAVSGSTITISSVTGDIVITCIATQQGGEGLSGIDVSESNVYISSANESITKNLPSILLDDFNTLVAEHPTMYVYSINNSVYGLNLNICGRYTSSWGSYTFSSNINSINDYVTEISDIEKGTDGLYRRTFKLDMTAIKNAVDTAIDNGDLDTSKAGTCIFFHLGDSTRIVYLLYSI